MSTEHQVPGGPRDLYQVEKCMSRRKAQTRLPPAAWHGSHWAGHSFFPMFSAEKQRELARKGSLKNGSMGSPVNQQPKKNNVMARTR